MSAALAIGVMTVMPGVTLAETPDRDSSQGIDDAIAFRERFGYRFDTEFVADLQENPLAHEGNLAYPVVFTRSEAKDWEARLDLEDDGMIVQEFYTNHPGRTDDFGGVRIDHEAGGLLAVYLRPGSPTPWLDDLKHPERVDIREARASWSELTSIEEAINHSRPDPATKDITEVHIDMDRGVVIVGLEPEALPGAGKVPTWITERYGDGPIEVQPIASWSEGTATIRAGYGFHENSVSGDFECSFGFQMDNHDRYLTAGHCVKGDAGNAIYRGSGRVGEYGTTFQFADGEDGDIGRVIVDDGNSKTNQVDYAGYGLAPDSTSNSCVVGAFRYITGGEGGTGWGDVEGCNYTSRYEEFSPDIYVHHMVKYESGTGASAPSNWPIAGDSGGPVYTVITNEGQVVARGVQGSHGTETISGTKHWYAAYSYLSDLPSGWGVDVFPSDECSLAPPTITCPSS